MKFIGQLLDHQSNADQAELEHQKKPFTLAKRRLSGCNNSESSFGNWCGGFWRRT
jgi:hypothetical protein